MVKKQHLLQIDMPVLLLLRENEFAFSIKKAAKRAKATLSNLELEIIKDASHLRCASKPDDINEKILQFVNQ